MNKDTLVKVVNKYNGTVGYTVSDLNIHRNFYPRESKEISVEELEKLTFEPGGLVILKDYLEIEDKEIARKILNIDPEPEYFYTREDIQNLMINGTLDQFLDCLDFAPQGVKELVKDIAVELPLNDVSKRNAIKEKLNFDVTHAIEIKNTKSEAEEENETIEKSTGASRRSAPLKTETPTATPTGRRYQPINKNN